MDECWDTEIMDSSAVFANVTLNNEKSSNRFLPRKNHDNYLHQQKSTVAHAAGGIDENIHISKVGRSKLRDTGRSHLNRNELISRAIDTIELEVNKADVGKIIGCGGRRIKALQNESNAIINIVPVIRITGTHSARERAKGLIEEVVKDLKKMSTINYSSNKETESSKNLFQTDETMKEKEIENKKLEIVPPVRKHFYIADPEVQAMSKKAAADFRLSKNNISVCCSPEYHKLIPNPVSTFKQVFKNFPELLEDLKKNFKSPTPIQSQAWPMILSGFDVLMISQTGTGKSVTFLLPAYIHSYHQITPRHQRVGPTCLIITPTILSVLGIGTEVQKFSYRNMKSSVYIDGNRRGTIGIDNKRMEIIITTPQKLNDLITDKVLNISSVSYLVFDKIGIMLNMGFEPQLRKIVHDVHPNRQTVMTSAIWTEKIEKFASQSMDTPAKVHVRTLDMLRTRSLKQKIIIAEDNERKDLTIKFIAQVGPQDKVVVFVRDKSDIEDLSSDLLSQRISFQSVHEDQEQSEMEKALLDLIEGNVNLLIATDVVSKGLDIKSATYILNMYFPKNIEEYIYRLSKTVRDKKAVAVVSIFCRKDKAKAASLIKILETQNQDIPEELYTM